MPNLLSLINDPSLAFITRLGAGRGERSGNSWSYRRSQLSWTWGARSKPPALRGAAAAAAASPSACWLAGTSASAASPGEGRAPRLTRSHSLREPQLPPGETSDFPIEEPRPRSPLPGSLPFTRPPAPPKSGGPRKPRKPRLVRTRSGRQGSVPWGPAAPSRPSKRCGRRAPAAKTPRILYRGKSGSSSKMGRQGLGGAGAAGRSMQRSQSRSSLSASFEALAGYFPCMNSLEEEGEAVVGVSACTSPVSRSRWLEGWQGLENSK